MSRYAAGTLVSTEKSRAEIERTLSRYGATAFAYGWEGRIAVIQFKAKDRHIKFILPLPDPSDKRFASSPSGRVRYDETQRRAAWDRFSCWWRSMRHTRPRPCS